MRTEERRREYKELGHEAKREVAKATRKAYDEMYGWMDTKEVKDLY